MAGKVLVAALLKFTPIFQSTRCLAFFGTPHRGPSVEIRGSILTVKILKSGSLVHVPFPENDPLNVFSETFADNSEELNDQFLGVLRLATNLSILSFYEMRKTRIMVR
jgi:hypothetical protein